MYIRPSTALRNEYNEISRLCKEKGRPVYLTKNGEGDLVVMSINAYEQRELLLDVRQKLLMAEESRLKGEKAYTVDEVRKHIVDRAGTNA
ncbi:MAG: type II toxin-antitoxin system Phd/YefM family antitoxin [Firmicutes bacterium]|nr:type II toxin-antitoxin system Phd/YefM family antitoxin [Bacillota bacterium]